MSTWHEGRLVMSNALVLGAAALALSLVLSAASASAQVYVTPSYGYGYPWFRNQCMTTRPAIGVATGMGGARLLLRARARRRGLGIIEPSLLSPRWGGG